MAKERELKKLSEESLTRQPEEVFDIICKLGEGSYGSVYKALHKESGHVLAIKQVPVDTDLQEIIKEISIMQQCDSPYIVKYYGSYFKNTDLWIVMEYCSAGSVSDIIRLRKKTLSEDEIATILLDTLRGLDYLHSRRKIHRDIKAGNILLNSEGHAKLADFGVAGQLTDTLAKRNTVIGSPFWMAPEIIQEIGYDCVADIWSLGITALEMAEGKPPYGDIHPMRAIFMIPTKPPPSFREPDKWTTEFIDFVSICLVKNPIERATAADLLGLDFIKNAKGPGILTLMIHEANEIRENRYKNRASGSNLTIMKQSISEESSDEVDDHTLVRRTNFGKEMLVNISHGDTLVELESDLGTMVINSDTDEEIESTQGVKKYVPLFLSHFDSKDKEMKGNDLSTPASLDKPEVPPKNQHFQSHIHLQFNHQVPQQMHSTQPQEHKTQVHHPLLDGDFEFLNNLSYEELQERMANLDIDMEIEIDELWRRYQIKRQPILNAIDTKRKRLQHF